MLVLAVTLFSSCRKEEDRVIPRSKMASIYAEMMVLDQWLQLTPDAKKIADTSLVYEPILEKYGYDSETYRRSVYKYLDDPERFARILRSTIDIFDKRLKELEALKEIDVKQQQRAEEMKKYRIDFNVDEHFPFMFKEPYVHYYDSLAFEIDSLTHEYRFMNVDRSDTTYEGIRMMIRIDSTAVSDSLARLDSLARADSLATVDSLAKVDSIRKAAAKTVTKKPVPRKSVNRALIQSAAEMELINEPRKKEND